MSEPYIAEIRLFGLNFAVRGWAFCNGQLLPIAQNTALFSLLGTIYGGDGRTTLALPDMRGRVPVHSGASIGAGLTERRLGERGGQESVALTTLEIPSHNHGVRMRAESLNASTDNPSGNILAKTPGVNSYRPNVAREDVFMDSAALTQNNVGGSRSHPNMMPYLAVNFEISLMGIFPSRS
jgi:microcystin-dependent protein